MLSAELSIFVYISTILPLFSYLYTFIYFLWFFAFWIILCFLFLVAPCSEICVGKYCLPVFSFFSFFFFVFCSSVQRICYIFSLSLSLSLSLYCVLYCLLALYLLFVVFFVFWSLSFSVFLGSCLVLTRYLFFYSFNVFCASLILSIVDLFSFFFQ